MNDLSASWLGSGEAVDVAQRVLESGWYVHGPEHAAFERELADFVGGEFALGVASGTDALALALAAIGCGPESVVVTVANAGAYTSVAGRAKRTLASRLGGPGFGTTTRQ